MVVCVLFNNIIGLLFGGNCMLFGVIVIDGNDILCFKLYLLFNNCVFMWLLLGDICYEWFIKLIMVFLGKIVVCGLVCMCIWVFLGGSIVFKLILVLYFGIILKLFLDFSVCLVRLLKLVVIFVE